jgi:hypothetical protein
MQSYAKKRTFTTEIFLSLGNLGERPYDYKYLPLQFIFVFFCKNLFSLYCICYGQLSCIMVYIILPCTRRVIMGTKNGKIKWGILGYARIARVNVIPAMLRSSNAEFYAIASRDKTKLKECGDTYPVSKTYESYDLLLDDPDVEAVYIPLPNALHKEWTIKAARKGKHVLCEKPIALNATECDEMIRICKEKKVKFMEAFMYRYTHRTKKVNEILASGKLGEIKYINSCYRFLLANPASIKLIPELGGAVHYTMWAAILLILSG